MTAQIKTQNQLHPPLPKKKRVDKLGNHFKKLYFKAGNSSMLLCKGLTDNGCKALIGAINDAASKLGTTIEGTFICTN